MADLLTRAIAAARLDAQVYEEVEADRTALGQAMLVVVAAAVGGGIGTYGTGGMVGVVIGILAALIGWYVWAFFNWLIGTKLLATPETSADIGELLRTTGFAASPGVLGVLGLVPGVGAALMVAASVWQLAATVIAVRQALDYKSTLRAFIVALIGYVAMVLTAFAVWMLVLSLFGGAASSDAPAIGALRSLLEVVFS